MWESGGGAEGIRTPDFLLAKEALSRPELQPHDERVALRGGRHGTSLPGAVHGGLAPVIRNRKHLNDWIVEGNLSFSVLRCGVPDGKFFFGDALGAAGNSFSLGARGPFGESCSTRGFRTAHLPNDLVTSARSGRSLLPRKEVIQPHLPVQLPCYDFVPVTDPTLGAYLPTRGLVQRLQVLPTSMT